MIGPKTAPTIVVGLLVARAAVVGLLVARAAAAPVGVALSFMGGGSVGESVGGGAGFIAMTVGTVVGVGSVRRRATAVAVLVGSLVDSGVLDKRGVGVAMGRVFVVVRTAGWRTLTVGDERARGDSFVGAVGTGVDFLRIVGALAGAFGLARAFGLTGAFRGLGFVFIAFFRDLGSGLATPLVGIALGAAVAFGVVRSGLAVGLAVSSGLAVGANVVEAAKVFAGRTVLALVTGVGRVEARCVGVG